MGNRIHALAQQLTGKATLEKCGLEELQHIAQRYPYFAPAQFLLLQKLRQMGSAEEAEKQYKRAVLFYHDPLLFEHFISSNRFYVDEIMTVVPVIETLEQNDIQQEETQKTEQAKVTGDPIELFAVDEEDDKIIRDHAVHSLNTEDKKDKTIIENQDNSLAGTTASEIIDTEAFERNETEDRLQINHQDIILSKLRAEEKPETELAFEPYHTVDYFASQGIKISQEELPKDKLGKQLKSFTEWLKTMKRLPVAQITDTVESSAEKSVESMASHSVTESNVVTEAMAEVWVKQGKTEKALDIYNKLSLLNPSKKAYFASKIENLKQS